jgi:hypothetical protein
MGYRRRRRAMRERRRAYAKDSTLAHVKEGHLPEGNVFWKDIPATARVTEYTHGWGVRFADGRQATAYWMGNDAREAQQWLRARARRDSR